MKTIVEELSSFIDTAKRNRKYPQGTAVGRRAALKLFETELNEEEKESLETFKSNLEQIYQNVFNKNKSKMSADSLITYKNRLKKLIEDYEEYGIDPTKMAVWNRPIRKTNKSQDRQEPKLNSIEEEKQELLPQGKSADFSRFELPLRPGVKAIIIVPSDINKEEVKKLRSYIDFLDTISKEEKDFKESASEAS